MSQLNFLPVSKVKSRNQKNLLTKKTTTIIGKTEDIDPFNFETETEKTFKIEDDFLKKDNCTSLYLGQEPIMQKCYICSICNPKKNHLICKYCYDNCHLNCRKIEGFNSEKIKEDNNYLNEKEFSCYCGLRLKHKPNQIIKNELIACTLMELDEALNTDYFYCENHNINICCICSVSCHKKCNITKIKKEDNNDIINCLCEEDKHTNFNELALDFNLDDYTKLSGVKIWKIQVLNILFNNQNTFQKLSYLIAAIINNNNNIININNLRNLDIYEINEDMKKKFFPLLELFTNIFHQKFKTYYYQDEILDMFKFENLIIYIHQLEINDIQSLLLKFRLISVLYFIHLRKDFQMVKSLISDDFLTNNIIERLCYKKMLSKKTIYTSGLDIKYNLENLYYNDNVLKKIVLQDICNIIEIGMDYVSIEEKEIEFEITLKFISFMLKRLIFTNEDLISLIKSLYNFYNRFYKYVNNDKSNIYSLLNIFSELSQIFYMITVNYNDNVIMDYLDNNKNIQDEQSIKNIKDFIHKKSDYGNLLFKIVLKSCVFLQKHYLLLQKNEIELDEEEKKRQLKIQNEKNKFQEKIGLKVNNGFKIKLPENGGLFREKIIKLFNETIKIFSLADNIYYKQIEKITPNEILEYYNFTEKIKDGKNQILNQTQSLNINELLYNLKLSIETKLTGLFTSSYSGENLNINNKIHQSILYFSDMMREKFLSSELESDIPNEKEMIYNGNYSKYKLYERYGKDIILTFDDFIKFDGKKLSDYIIKLASMNSNFFYYFNNYSFHRFIVDYVDYLILSNIDETLSKVLVFLSERKFPNLLSYGLLDIILKFFSIYFFTKRGMKYFLMGKNLSRINKIFNRFYLKPNNKNIDESNGKNIEENLKKINCILQFLNLMLKGINLYGLTLKNHKIIKRFKKNLIEHIEEFNRILKKTEFSEEFKIQFTLIMKIFQKLNKDYEYEQFEEIKHRVIIIFCNCSLNLLETKTFSSFFSFENEEEEKKEEEDNISTSKKNKLILKENSVAGNTEDIKSNKNTLTKEDVVLEDNIFEKKITLNLYFSFFNLISFQTFYHFNSEDDINIYNKLYTFCDLEIFRKLFNSNQITLKQKTRIFKFLRSIFFIEKLDYYNILDRKKHLSNLEFKKLFESKIIEEKLINEQVDLSEFKEEEKEILNEINNKYNIINKIDEIIKLYISELKKFPIQFKGNTINSCLILYKELLLGIKFISNFFYYEKEIWSRLILTNYELCIEFIPKIEIFKTVHREILKQRNLKIFDFNLAQLENLNNEDNENNINKKIEILNSNSFNLYNKNEVYKFIYEGYDEICKFTGFNKDYNLQKFLEIFDTMAEANFTPFSLIETLDYEYFYEGENEENDNNLLSIKTYKIKSIYLESFVDVNNTNFLNVFTRVSNDIKITDYRKAFIEYFNIFLNSIEGNNSQKLEDLICIITKLLFYDCEGMQSKFEYLINDKYFFSNINKLLNYYIVITFTLYRNIFAYDRILRIGNLTKLIIQFLQSLGEGFNTFFHDNIFKLRENIPIKEKKFEEKNLEEDDLIDNNNIIIDNNIVIDNDDKTIKTEDTKKKKKKKKSKKFENFKNISTSIPEFKINVPIYESIIYNLKRSYFFLDLDKLIDSEMHYDKLIILTTNFIDFLIEYIETTDDNIDLLKNYMKILFLGNKFEGEKNVYEILDYKPVLNVLFLKIKPEKDNNKLYLLRKKVICYVKMKYVQLLISYLQIGKDEIFVDKLIQLKFSSIELFQEILYNFKELLLNLKDIDVELYNSLIKINNDDTYVNKLIEFYTYEPKFRNIIEFPLCLKLYILIKTYEDIYFEVSLKNHFERLTVYEDKINDIDNVGIRSKFSKRIYKFLEKIVIKVEVRKEIIEEKEENEELNNKNNIEIITDNIMKKLNKNNEKENEIGNEEYIYEDENINYSNFNNKIIFFARPYITFTLSDNSKNSFVEKVDRSNATSKFISLINFADYCLFEMIVNLNRNGKSEFNNYMTNLNFKTIEIINYLLIIVQNLLLMYHYYISPDVDFSVYDIKDESLTYHIFISNLIVSIIQILFLILSLIIWFYFRFINYYQYNLMQKFNQSFIFRRKNEEKIISPEVIDLFKEDKQISVYNVQKDINKDISLYKKINISIIECVLGNREINILIYSILLSSLYLITRSSLFLVVQTLFIANIIETLFNIFKAMKMKFLSIIIVLIFDFIIVYLFMWFSYFYFSDFFHFDQILDRESHEKIPEPFCYSSLQCLLFMIQKGITQGGGIGEVIDKVSYYHDIPFFIMRFFYDMLFFIIIILILGNVFLGIIVDTFGQLRDDNYYRENDMNNICFICQLSRDNCLIRNIDFQKHKKGIHNLWNYVYFLIYLHINNSNDFNREETSVWERLANQDFSWIPIEKSEV